MDRVGTFGFRCVADATQSADQLKTSSSVPKVPLGGIDVAALGKTARATVASGVSADGGELCLRSKL